jgi:uncharacterized protein
MSRLILLLAVVFGMFWWLRSRAEALRRQAPPPRPAASPPAAGEPEAMVQCAQCGVHLPQSEAIAWRGLHYCRRSHLPDDRAA